MPRRRNQDALESRRVINSNEGADCFTDFFRQDHVMNRNPTKGFHDFMNTHDADLERGVLVKRGKKRG